MKRRREIDISEWEHLAAAYAKWAAWDRAWPRRVAKPWFRTQAFAAGLVIVWVPTVLLLRSRELASPGVMAGFAIALFLAIVASVHVSAKRCLEPRTRLMARRRVSSAWLASGDAGAIAAARRARWAEVLRRLPQSPARHPGFRGSMAAMLVIPAALGVTFLLPKMLAVMMLLPLIVLSSVGWMFLSQFRMARRYRARVMSGACIACGYECDREAAFKVGLGPERCPECGLAWPLVPPEPIE